MTIQADILDEMITRLGMADPRRNGSDLGNDIEARSRWAFAFNKQFVRGGAQSLLEAFKRAIR